MENSKGEIMYLIRFYEGTTIVRTEETKSRTLAEFICERSDRRAFVTINGEKTMLHCYATFHRIDPITYVINHWVNPAL